MKGCTDIHGSQKMTPTDFDDPLAFSLAHQHVKAITHHEKYLNIYLMNWHKVLYRHSWHQEDLS